MIMHVLVHSGQDAGLEDEVRIGGKAAGLAWLSRNGFRVPDWFVITSEAVEAMLQQGGLREQIERACRTLPADPEGQRAVLAGLRARITALRPFPMLRVALQTALAAFPDWERQFFAVRSSVVGEDGTTASFAGQMDSFLFQRGRGAIEAAVLRCVASAYSDRAVAYRRKMGLPLEEIRVAVVVQRMIEGDVSGVLFTAHPVTGSRRHMLLTASYGLGEGLVSGRCDADAFTVGIEDGSLVPQIQTKTCRVVFDGAAGVGTCEAAVPPALRQVSCLSEAQVRAIADLGAAIAARRGAPQDIEWTLREGEVFVLQTRPITALPPPQHPADAQRVVWDNANIQESYCGVTTPLTFSFARMAYATVYEQTMRVVQLPESVIQAHRPVLEGLLGLIKGRIYYNINNWYRGLLLLPSFSRNKSDMERMMGLQDPVDFVEDQHLNLTEKVRRLPRLARTLLHLQYHFGRMDRLVAAFEARFEAEYRRIDRGRLHMLDLAELSARIHTLRRSLLMRWSTPILNDFFVMMMNGRVRRVIERLDVESPDLLQNGLLAGEEEIESTAPTRRLLVLCEEVRSKPALARLFNEAPAARLPAAVQAADPAFYDRCRGYLERYGDRGIGELKLETVTPRQDPVLLFGQLRGLLERADLTPETLARNERQVRREAEEQVFSRVRARQGRFALRRFRRDLTRLRAAIRYRESMRMARTRLFGLFRDLYLEVGNQLSFYGLLDAPRDVFYLTVEEIDLYMEGRAVQADLKALCRARREEYARYEHEELPHHFATWGAPYHHNDYRYPHAQPAPAAPARTFQGTGCYPGQVEAEVEVVAAPEAAASLGGRILCTVRTDPGWAPLFPTASGLLIERGSTLSHSAVVARELGIPAIVGIPDITRHLRTGDRVRMDGGTGRVERVEPSLSDQEMPDDLDADRAAAGRF